MPLNLALHDHSRPVLEYVSYHYKCCDNYADYIWDFGWPSLRLATFSRLCKHLWLWCRSWRYPGWCGLSQWSREYPSHMRRKKLLPYQLFMARRDIPVQRCSYHLKPMPLFTPRPMLRPTALLICATQNSFANGVTAWWLAGFAQDMVDSCSVVGALPGCRLFGDGSGVKGQEFDSANFNVIVRNDNTCWMVNV